MNIKLYSGTTLWLIRAIQDLGGKASRARILQRLALMHPQLRAIDGHLIFSSSTNELIENGHLIKIGNPLTTTIEYKLD